MDEYQVLKDEAAVRRLAALYASAIDRRDREALAGIFVEDAVIEGPHRVFAGRAKIVDIPTKLRKIFSKTRHIVFNQTITIDGDAAEGETYANAYHVYHGDVLPRRVLILAIRYKDVYRRDGGTWKFARRQLVTDWSETRLMNLDMASNDAT